MTAIQTHRFDRLMNLRGETSILSGQNFYLRLLLLILLFIGAVEASLRQVCALTLLFLLFMLLDLGLYPKLLKGLRISLPFFAAYWLFATLFRTDFPAMALFTARILLFIVATVYAFGNLSLQRVLHDTRGLRKHKWGESLIHYLLATALFIRAYAKYFTRHKPNAGSSIGSVLDGMISAGTKVYRTTGAVERHMWTMLREKRENPESTPGNLIALSLMAMLVLVTSF